MNLGKREWNPHGFFFEEGHGMMANREEILPVVHAHSLQLCG
jgi:hypothetical protein